MASINRKIKNNRKTHEGAQAHSINPYQELRRSVLSCLLWESEFYESGISIANRINNLCNKVHPDKIKQLAIEARTKHYLRHVPLLLLINLAKLGKLNSETVNTVIQRSDELTELLSIYWKDGKIPISAQMKKGLAKAFAKFDEYQLAKYNRKKEIKLLDVMRLVHPKPKDKNQAELWGRLKTGTLKTPDTWEVALSGGANKKDAFERLMKEKKLGGLAFLRNLRNMIESGVQKKIITDYMNWSNFKRILPFRFIAAQMNNPSLSIELEKGMLKSLQNMEKLKGNTVLLVDVSGSMVGVPVSKRSQLDRLSAASGLAILVREVYEDIRIFAFSNYIKEIPNYHGFAIMDYLKNLDHSGTYLGRAIDEIMKINPDRLIIITDEQSHDTVNYPQHLKHGYILNVASYQNGIGYGNWIHIDGFSENIIKFIQEYENYKKS
jgi:hypothetical protein